MITTSHSQPSFQVFMANFIQPANAAAATTQLRAPTAGEAASACMTAFIVALAASPAVGALSWVVAAAALAGWIKFAMNTWKLGWEWLVVIICGGCWLLGAAFYFYMPLAGMSNPPMQWGYPRTVEGFIHAFTRGQYEKANPSDVIHHPLVFLTQ